MQPPRRLHPHAGRDFTSHSKPKSAGHMPSFRWQKVCLLSLIAMLFSGSTLLFEQKQYLTRASDNRAIFPSRKIKADRWTIPFKAAAACLLQAINKASQQTIVLAESFVTSSFSVFRTYTMRAHAISQYASPFTAESATSLYLHLDWICSNHGCAGKDGILGPPPKLATHATSHELMICSLCTIKLPTCA